MKKIVLAFFLLSSGAVVAQQAANAPFQYGFSAGAEFQTFSMGLLPHQPGDPYRSYRHDGGAGVSVGLWGNWSILPALSLRPGIQLAHTSGTIQYQWEDGQIFTWKYPFTELEMPIHFVLSNTFRRVPVQAKVLFGGRFSWNLSAEPADAPLHLLAQRLGLDIGLGAGIRLGAWTLSPELIYSYGLNNLHDFRNTPYDWTVGRILRDRVGFRVIVGRQ